MYKLPATFIYFDTHNCAKFTEKIKYKNFNTVIKFCPFFTGIYSNA